MIEDGQRGIPPLAVVSGQRASEERPTRSHTVRWWLGSRVRKLQEPRGGVIGHYGWAADYYNLVNGADIKRPSLATLLAASVQHVCFGASGCVLQASRHQNTRTHRRRDCLSSPVPARSKVYEELQNA